MKSLLFGLIFGIGSVLAYLAGAPVVALGQDRTEQEQAGRCCCDEVRVPRAETAIDGYGTAFYVVKANETWRRTDVEARRGQRIAIAASGLIKWAPDPASWTLVNAGGTVPPSRTGWNYSHFPFPEAGIGSLVMRIGKGVYAVGAASVVESDDDGYIELMVNDDILADNSGSFLVSVNVSDTK